MSKLKDGFADRLAAQAAAKKTLLDRFKPPSAPATPPPAEFRTREEERRAELEAVRAARAAAREAKRAASAQAQQDREEAEAKAREEAVTARKSAQRAELLAMYGRKRR